MFEVKKEITVDLAINIDQEGLEELVIQEIKRRDPTIIVDSIKFIQRRSPAGLDVVVDAHIDGQTAKAIKEVEPIEVAPEEPEVKKDLTPPEAEEPSQIAEEQPAKKTMKSLFES